MTDNPKSINVNPEFEKLSSECELLKEELAALFAEWEHLTKAVIPTIETNYVVKIGTLHHELLQIQIDIQRTKREIDIIQAALNRGDVVDQQQVIQQLDREFAEWKEKLEAQVADIKAAQRALSDMISGEDAAELRRLYRILAKKLHPDVNPDQSVEAHNLWLQVQSAYDMADLKQMQALHLLAGEIPENYDLPNSIDILKKRRADFKDQITNLLQKIAELKNLPIFEWEDCLDDPEYVEGQQTMIREQIAQAKEQRDVLHVDRRATLTRFLSRSAPNGDPPS